METPTPTSTPSLSPEGGAIVLGFLGFLIFLFLAPIVFHVVAYRYGCFEEFLTCVKLKTKDFDTRSRRKEYIGFAVANYLISYDFAFVDARMGTVFQGQSFGVFWILYTVLTFVPHVAVAVRRLHDTGRTGYWMFLALIPFVGFLGLSIILFFFDSQPGDNLYGPNPKGLIYQDQVVNAEYVPVHVAQQMNVAASASSDSGNAPLLDQSHSTLSKSYDPKGENQTGDESRTNLV